MRRPLMLVLAAAALAGCSSAPAVFDNAGGQPVTCLEHQTGEPGPTYTDPEQRSTGQVLALMRYYTAHGTMPFCDGGPAGDSDRAWARMYLDLGGSAENVTSPMG